MKHPSRQDCVNSLRMQCQPYVFTEGPRGQSTGPSSIVGMCQSKDTSAKSSSPGATRRSFIGNVGIDSYTESSLVDEVLQHSLHGKGTRQIVTVNAQIYVLADKSIRYRECLLSAEYLCADGMPLVWACNCLGRMNISRIAGVDLIDRLCEHGATEGLKVFLLGGRPNSAARAARSLSRRHRGLEIAGVSCPDWGFETRAETLDPVLEQIAKAKPHIVFVALGAPKQEFFIDDWIRPLNVPIGIGVGGSFEFLSGLVDRAPMWMQTGGLEWVFRLSGDPKRMWKRYLIGNPEFMWSLMKWKLRKCALRHRNFPEKVAS
jgi:N-acetylglucosaminyldiphosphoundecaprenol N-acetyl-beta-D-mannosaminyltransferase